MVFQEADHSTAFTQVWVTEAIEELNCEIQPTKKWQSAVRVSQRRIRQKGK